MTHELVVLRPHPALKCRCSCSRRWVLTVPALSGETADDTLAYAQRNFANHVRMYAQVAKEVVT